jgi:hypothetical protein
LKVNKFWKELRAPYKFASLVFAVSLAIACVPFNPKYRVLAYAVDVLLMFVTGLVLLVYDPIKWLINAQRQRRNKSNA